ncbi:hypothetical protein BDBG_17775 [Blastomyces gilchristii SLH14081]|uniref:Uncharacterized protein n=1 Tax=Blastomyces gilchristii (strain SLH14081) TaxID=559298 RepID=A0A179V3X7_BLAGS|nr:uncharacterized protein BDBG_17775 [Blastomyces gilchristii SLH14081]OAT13292.1 hypothetical protein BDBG_17775 [Blastomyces gilchristii SLH14081]
MPGSQRNEARECVGSQIRQPVAQVLDYFPPDMDFIHSSALTPYIQPCFHSFQPSAELPTTNPHILRTYIPSDQARYSKRKKASAYLPLACLALHGIHHIDNDFI